jgi:hypothetical protein
MEVLSKLRDGRINADNILIELTIKEYLELAEKILSKNEFQRQRVGSSKTVYSLLKADLLKGCVIPPIVLASSSDSEKALDVVKLIENGDLLILDGLQRTMTLLDIKKELVANGDKEKLEEIYRGKIRVEIYSGVNRLGVLYRMLTLNTGQTPVSLRHQIEILYIDYINRDISGIHLIREVDDEAPGKSKEYVFRDIVDGFNAYLDRDILPMDRLDVLDNIRGLEKLSTENQKLDLFKQFVITYNNFIEKVEMLSKDWVQGENTKTISRPFGKTTRKIFSKSQAMTGFGSAVGKLVDYKLVTGFEQIDDMISKLDNIGPDTSAIDQLLLNLNTIKEQSKKIGTSQRFYFHYFFRELFNHDGDSYLKFDLAVQNGYNKYLSQTV